MVRWWLAGLAGVVMLGSGADRLAAQGVEERRTLEVKGMRRSYLLFRPAGTVASKRPLVLVFHGGSGSARGIARHTGFTRLAQQEGFVVVYPQGVGRRWNDGRGLHSAYDDVGFVRALLDTLRRELAVDERRIYATGISNGAVFVYRLACDLPGALAAIAPVAGTLAATIEPRCATATPTAIAAFHGTADRLMPYQGRGGSGRGGGGRAVLSAERSVAVWAHVNGCVGLPTDSLLPEHDRADGTRARRLSYRGCRSRRPVVLYRVEGGGHTWPDGPPVAAAMGRVSRELDATRLIWQFFKTLPP